MVIHVIIQLIPIAYVMVFFYVNCLYTTIFIYDILLSLVLLFCAKEAKNILLRNFYRINFYRLGEIKFIEKIIFYYTLSLIRIP